MSINIQSKKKRYAYDLWVVFDLCKIMPIGTYAVELDCNADPYDGKFVVSAIASEFYGDSGKSPFKKNPACKLDVVTVYSQKICNLAYSTGYSTTMYTVTNIRKA